VAIAVNNVTTDTDALVESSPITWADDATGVLVIGAASNGSIKAFSLAGAALSARSPRSRAPALRGRGRFGP
jgi:hypothetical protein